MQTNEAFGGMAKQVAFQIARMGDNERGSVLSSTYKNLKWAGEPAMRKQLNRTDIQFSKRKTIYVVLSKEAMNTQMRWVRVVTAVSLILEERKNKPTKELPTWYILDEFNQIGGDLDAINKGFAILRSANIKLWLFFQNIPQIRDAFGKKWEDVISGSTVQVLGVNDTETAE